MHAGVYASSTSTGAQRACEKLVAHSITRSALAQAASGVYCHSAVSSAAAPSTTAGRNQLGRASFVVSLRRELRDQRVERDRLLGIRHIAGHRDERLRHLIEPLVGPQ